MRKKNNFLFTLMFILNVGIEFEVQYMSDLYQSIVAFLFYMAGYVLEFRIKEFGEEIEKILELCLIRIGNLLIFYVKCYFLNI